MNMRYRLIVSLLLTTWLAVGSAMAGVKVTGNVYGGGNLAEVGQSVTVNISGGEVEGDVYGGGALANTNTENWVSDALVTPGYNAVTLTKGTSLVGYYSKSGDVYTLLTSGIAPEGGGTYYKKTETIVVLTGGTVMGDVYGGGLGRNATTGENAVSEVQAIVYGDVTVTVNGTKMVTHQTNGALDAGRVFGANNIKGTPKGHVKVLVQKTTQVTTPSQAIDVAAVFGGGNQAAYEPYNANDYAEVEINKTPSDGRLIVGNVYGGGNEAGIEAGTQVTIVAGDVKSGIYGGCNSSGSVTGNIAVNINGGMLGTNSASMTSGIFGGGYGASTSTGGNVTVTVGNVAGTYTPTIYADIYGGSAFGDVNGSDGDLTTIDFLNGTLHGNIYGGGLGDKQSLGQGHSDVAARVFGEVVVNIGKPDTEQTVAQCKIDLSDANIYGCNNTNGSPQADVTVNIYKTAHTTTDAASYIANDGTNGAPTFAIKEVFGGGNQAAYSPATVTSGDPRCATVHVYTCLNTVETIYGGGNAADATDVKLIIVGGRFDRIFGGGNGYSSTGNHSDSTQPNYNPGANITGSATTEVHGGHYRQVFGGSNQYGDVASASLTLDTNSDCEELVIEESFGGANEAEITGDVTTTLACSSETSTFSIGSFYGGSNMADIKGNVTLNVYGGTYTNVFGGSKGVSGGTAANIIDNPSTENITEGNVTLNLYGGTIENAFGGSDANGNITGKITVNMLNLGGNCPLTIHNIYGGGRDAAYEPTTSGAYPEVNLINGTVSKKNDDTGGNVFGGGLGSTATVTSNPTVNVGYVASMSTLVTSLLPEDVTFSEASVSIEGNVYGGGEQAAVAGGTALTVQQGTAENMTITTAVVGDVYGGGALANVGTSASDATQVTISGGTITGNVYGGGLGRNSEPAVLYTAEDAEVIAGTKQVGEEKVPAKGPIAALVNGAVTVTVNGGTIEDVFGCNNVNGSPQSTVTVNINNNVGGNVYGGGNLAAYTAPEGTPNYPAVNINNGTVTHSVYGGGKGSTAVVTGNPVVTIGDNNADHYAVVTENVYGGGDAAAVTGNTTVTYNDTHASSMVAKLFGGGNAAGVTGNTSVTLTAGIVTSGVYGGCNSSGTIEGASTVSINGGTIGFGGNSGINRQANVHGGGYGENTYVKGNVTVNIGSSTTGSNTTTYSGNATIYGDVYGGGALGHVNAEENTAQGATEPTYTQNATTKVNLYKGNIYGDAYGGGLGDASHAAYVGGSVTVEQYEVSYHIRTTTESGLTYPVSGRIFGANNANGSPKGHVLVHVYKTVEAKSTYGENGVYYHVASVFGGGNEADYNPSAADYAEVIIEGCDVTRIKDVYGGGNAAAVPASQVWILGTDLIDNVFGGGNGERGANYAAHVGYHRTSSGKTAYSSGTGSANTYLVAGKINSVYGGSNSNGDIRRGANVNTTTLSTYSGTANLTGASCCNKLTTQHIYGGGNQAEMTGDVNITLDCMPDDYVDAVYGGAANAIVNGNVTLTVTSGKFGRVFGGNNDGGSINGSITVNIYEDGCKPLIIGELYGAGNNAPYSIYGCTPPAANSPEGTPWTPNTQAPEGKGPNVPVNDNAVTVNVFSCTSIGKVYGGGKGSTATVIGNTHVWINMLNGIINGTAKTKQDDNYLGKIGQVFGGGSAANVIGNTTIDIGTATIYTDENSVNKDLIGVNIVPGSDYLSPTSDTSVSITDAGVYGGGEAANVDGNTTLNIGTKNLSEGTNITGNIFGGGLGETTHVTGDVTVNIGADTGTAPNHNYVGYATITGDVYGGSAKGKVNSYLNNNVETASTGKTTQVNLYGGSITGNVYGGGLGDASDAADVYGAVTVNVKGGSANNVFGCNNTNGSPQDNVTVNIDGGRIYQSVYGGGNQAIMDGSPVVNVTAGTIGTDNEGSTVYGGAVYGNVYGGGLGSDGTGNQTDLDKVKAGLVKGNTTINISGGTILHNIYGGGAYGSVGTFTYNESTGVINGYTSGGKATINITGGTIGTNGDENGMVFGSSRGDVGDLNSIHNKLAWVYDTEVKIGTASTPTVLTTPLIKGSVYGGGENGHNYRNADVYIYSGTIGIATGAEIVSNNGTPNDESDDIHYLGAQYPYRGNVYGAGCGTDKYWIDEDSDNTIDDGEEYFNPLAGIVQGNATISMSGGLVVHNMYGAGAMGSVGTANGGGVTTINISGGSVGVSGIAGAGNVFGAARGDAAAISNEYALVRDHTTVNISDGTIYGNVYGGGELGCVGRYIISSDMRNFYWTDEALDANKTSYTYNNTGVCNVNITGSTASIKGNVFGGGKGKEDTFWCEKGIAYKTYVTITNGTVDNNVYGGGQVGRVETDATVKIGPDSDTGSPEIKGDVFGAGAGVETHGYSALVRGNTYVTVQSGAKVHENVYGGGELAAVGKYYLNAAGMPYSLVDENLGVCTVTIKGGAEIGYNGTGHVFGGGKGKVPTYYLGNVVSLSDTTQMPKRMMSYTADRYNNNDENPLKNLWGYSDASHHYVWEYFNTRAKYHAFLETLALATRTVVSIEGSAKVNGSVYGGSESGFVQHNTSVTIKESSTIGVNGTTENDGNVYGGGLGLEIFDDAGRVSGNTTVNINGGTVRRNVYGGGAYGYVRQSVTVGVSSGIVIGDVYGGGALADTNTDNWDATKNSGVGDWADNMNDDGTTYKTTVNINGGTIGNAYGGGLGQLGTGVYYTQEECNSYNNSTNITGWIASGTALTADQATLVNNALGLTGNAAYAENSQISEAHSAAYNATLAGYRTTADWKVHPSNGTGAVKAIVYGDVTVTVNGYDETTSEYGTAKFTIASEDHTYQKTVRNSNNEEEIVTTTGTVYTKGRVFGCNNLNGSPKGNVTVSVWQTMPLEGSTHTYTEVGGTYEIQGVYGGGNLANYEPATGKKTTVDIHGCDRTSIQYVFGGGNAASVPETHVNIYGTFEIEAVFGGGNGNEPIKSEGTWVQNPGAEIMGDTNVRLMAGLMHQAFGGSFERGIIHGSTNLEKNGEGGEGCVLKITDIFGGGKDADVQAVNIVLSECNMNNIPGVEQSDVTQQIENVYAGSYNAKIFGPVTMTIRSGTFKNVFGGNYSGGFINGPITVNVEETENCKPIKITNLYGGGNYAPYPGAGAHNSNPKITVNVKACTSIGNVYGGSFHADVNGDTEVNINMIKGWWAGKTYTQTTATGEISEVIPNDIGLIGNVYGGGDQGDVLGNTVVNIGNLTEIDLVTVPDPDPLNGDQVPAQFTKNGNGKYNVLGAHISGNVYGGGNLADVTGITNVSICAAKGNVISDTQGNPTDYNYTPVNLATTAGSDYKGVTIGGNVYGGGKGEDSNFMCDKAMIGTANDGGAGGKGRTFVCIGNGTVNGNVYGGGKIGRVEANTKVTIGLGGGGTTPASAPIIRGSVFGAGQGAETHGYSGLVRGISTVTVQGDSEVKGSVYGGGEMATVGRFWIKDVNNKDNEGNLIVDNEGNSAPEPHEDVPTGMPYALIGGGACTVTIQGNAIIGPDDMQMPTFSGNVFGAGKGILPTGYDYQSGTPKENHYPRRMVLFDTQTHNSGNQAYWEYVDPTNSDINKNIWEYFPDEPSYLRFIQTLALVDETDVTIKGNAFVKGSVYGGSENGRVLDDTDVKIQGDCQIGAGYANNTLLAKYDVNDFIDPITTTVTTSNAMAECNHWPYGVTVGTGDNAKTIYAPYDKYAHNDGYYYNGNTKPENAVYAEGGMPEGSDGHTFYGNVFGGGSGYFPYKDSNGQSQWHNMAGAVGGNTRVTITGGHILTNVYGGNELTNVGNKEDIFTVGKGKCTVKMSGGTLGVPRTLTQIADHPVTCYLFGAGKGDQRVFFNKETNVKEVEIEVSGGIIYGSVFGGGEDGHVMGNVWMKIQDGAKIGTWGTSYVDGNVFGGGRGFGGDAYTAGNVGGSIDMYISGGTMLGSIYGGGRLGSVGYGLYDATTNNQPTPGYGEMRDDGKNDAGDSEDYFTSTSSLGSVRGRGHVDINITGGTIGNKYEFKYLTSSVSTDNKTDEEIAAARKAELEDTYYLPFTDAVYDTDRGYYMLNHTKGGNVYAGGMGRYTQLDGSTPISTYDSDHKLTSPIEWTKLGNVKSTKLTISGTNTWIMGNVYGGGEFGAVTGSHAANNPQEVGTEIIVTTGATIGTEITENTTVKYTFGSVYGGGMGAEYHDVNDNHGGNVVSNTSVSISGAATKVRASVFGGGEMAAVGKDTYVTVSDGEIGRNEVWGTTEVYNTDAGGDHYNPGYVKFGGATMGNVYGGGKGHVDHTLAGVVKGNTNVTVSGGSIYHNVYGGGALASVGTFGVADSESTYVPEGVPFGWTENTGTATVTITGGTIGISGRDNGMVNGSSRGNIAKPVETAFNKTTVYKDPYDKVAWVNKSIVTIGTPEASTGPTIKGSVYGGGENGHNAEDATVNVYSGKIGIFSGEEWYDFGNVDINEKALATRGNVYGAGCGTDTYWDDADNDGTVDAGEEHHNLWSGIVAGNTYVTVSGGHVANNVYGGGSMGSVGTIISDLDDTRKQHKTASTDGKETYYDFGLSWPLEIDYASNTGTTNVTIDGSAAIDGSVFGSARGTVELGESDIEKHRYVEAKFANVRETKVVVGTANGTDKTKPTIGHSVYGGGEDGHVYENASVTIHHGKIARSVFGGGKGEGTFSTTLWKSTNTGNTPEPLASPKTHSWTAGRVYGNTTVTMYDGIVGWFIYGGGNLGSVGKGNYAGGADDYSVGGYGELPSAGGNLWTTTSTATSETKDMAYHFLNSGIAKVNILGGEVGSLDGALVGDTYKSYDDDGVPYGSVFGGSRGKAAANSTQSPRYRYLPDFFLGYVNKAIINIGGTSINNLSSKTPIIYGSIYGGGQDGHVRNNTEVKIFKGNIAGQATTTDTSGRSGHVFGAGSGIGTYHDNSDNKDKCNNASGSVTCTTLVEVYGENSDNETTATTKIKGNIYGGGAMASVGPPQTGHDEYDAADESYSHTQVNIKGGRIGGSVFAASRGPSDAFRAQSFEGKGIAYDPYSFATVLWPNVHVSGGKIVGSVYGGGETGYVKCGVNVDITGGTIDTDVYGGGAMANTNIDNLKQDGETEVWSWTDNTNRTAKYTTIVNLLGGTIGGDAYGGGLGRREYGTSGQDGYESAVEAKVYGDVRVNLNGLETADYDDGIHGETPGIGERLEKLSNNNYQVKDAAKGAIVNRVFGCNNLLGSPQGKVRVHVFGTQNADAQHNTINLKYPIPTDNSTVSVYDVEAVYGGGNLAAYTPMGPSAPGKNSTTIVDDYLNTTQKTEVIIDGCHRTSIKQVYGGGNAAPVPETRVEVNGTYEIDEVFGGGNGDTNYTLVENGVTKYYQNPGANVGYRNYTTVNKNDAEHDGSTDANAYPAVENSDAATKELRQANYTYGTGIATTEIKGGRIHVVYGGSNKKGNISTTALSMYEGMNDECPMEVDESYGAGKDAPIDGVVDVKMKCATGVKELFGGAKNSDVNSDINLTITNGSSLERVFGGNNTSGAIAGSITVNIEEGGCEPIHIGELYLGGYLAPYSVYGYEDNGRGGYVTENINYGGDIGTIPQRKPLTKADWETYKTTLQGYIKADIVALGFNENEDPTDEDIAAKVAADPTLSEKAIELAALKERLYSYPKKDPRINIISASRIDNVFGGGYRALVVGNPHINVNMTTGRVDKEFVDEHTEHPNFVGTHTDPTTGVVLYKGEGTYENGDGKLAIGTIGNIYGGGNMAAIYGDTYLEIGTGEWLNRDDQREILGTTTTINTPTTFTYDESSKKWRYDRTTTAPVAVTGTINPAGGSTIPETPVNGQTVQGTSQDDGITTPTTFTYVKPDGSESGYWTYLKTTTTIESIDGTPTPVRYTAKITGDVFGGGNLGDIGQTQLEEVDGKDTDVIYSSGNTHVTIGARKAMVNDEEVWQGVAEATMVEDNVGDITGVSITGNVYGGGEGEALESGDGAFRCGKAMVTGGTNIVIGNGTVKRTQRNIGTAQTPKYEWTGTIYGGGKVGRVEENTSVTIGLGDGVDDTGTPTSAPVIEGSVFGAGAGVNTHGYSALVRGSSTVTVQGNAKIGRSVYGGGEVASVGRYNIGSDGLPVTLYDESSPTSGHCYVTVKGYAEIGPDNMKMKKEDGSDPDDTGYVFGAGKGVLPLENVVGDPGRVTPNNTMAYYENAVTATGCSTDYSKYLRTLALATQTDVTITGHAFVKGSVYGGAENSFVQSDTHVVIDGDCQIGNGEGVNRRYTDEEWAQGKLLSGSEEMLSKYSNSLPECASWPYGQKITVSGQTKKIFAPYDKYAMTTVGHEEEYEDGSSTNGGRRQGSDGHTFYGNVFGGGSGFWPYAPGLWYEYAGSVYGNSIVDIKGGHILTSVYGGNELTNVGRYKYTAISLGQGNTTTDIELLSGGDCYVTMTGGTLGVPRTVEEIAAHPVTCYLFGSGKGDQRIFFNTATNVGNAFVHVSDDARIYGSVFGGGEDGHVIKDVELSIGSSTLPSTLPTKSVFTGVTLAGRKAVTIGGNTVNYPYIGTTGTSYVDGNIFGAGRGYSGEALTAGSVGGNVEVNIKGGTMLGSVYGGGRMASVGTLFTSSTDPYYGQLQEDDGTNIHGHITLNISGGTIGNDQEDILVKHTKGGNVFGGSMGKLELQDGSINPLWPKMAVSKTTKVNISGDALIKSNVYGGGEFSMVRGDTYVTIGGVLGDDNKTITSTNSDAPTIKRDVYGGGYGSDDFTTKTTISAGGFDASTYTFTPMQFAGIVCGDTYVNMKRGWVMKNVYGGGEMATVGLIDFTNAERHEDHDGTIGETTEKLYGFALSWPYKLDFIPYDISNVVGGTTHVNITGGRLGITGKDFLGPYDGNGNPVDEDGNQLTEGSQAYKNARLDNGDVFGAGKGIAGPRYDYAFCANVRKTIVNIEYPENNTAKPDNYKKKDNNGNYLHECITGSVYAGGENGHVIEDTELTLKNGLVGHAIYGGGKGKDTYHKTGLPKLVGSGTYDADINSVTAGKVYGNTKVIMEGGYVVRNVYGGGNMASVGKGNYASGTDDYYPAGYGETLKDSKLWESSYDPEQAVSGTKPDMAYYFLNSGKTEVKVTGGQVGYVKTSDPSDSMKDGLPYGNVFGGCRGESAPNITESPRYFYCPKFYSGYVNETNVTIGTVGQENTDAGQPGKAPLILGNVYGGGQDGHVRRDANVVVNSGEIGLPLSGKNLEEGENAKTNETILGGIQINGKDNPQWLHRGNVYGAGSGISKYHYDFNYSNGTTFDDANGNGDLDDGEQIETGTYHGKSIDEVGYSTSAGSVTRNTRVDINGGIIHRNVYGGGSLSSVGPPTIPLDRPEFAYKPGTTTRDSKYLEDGESSAAGPGWWSMNTVNVKGTVGSQTDYQEHYGGEVYGASRGDLSIGEDFGMSVWTQVNILNGARIMGNVFGGGDNGMVKRDSEVFIGEPNTTSSSGTSGSSEPGGDPEPSGDPEPGNP